MTTRLAHLDRGCYEAPRAAALSGVPERTLYYWAERGIVVPSVSPVREKLWSYGDLLTLRLVNWLRHPKGAELDTTFARSTMTDIRRALTALGDDLWIGDQPGQERPSVAVDAAGRIFVTDPLRTADGQQALEVLDLLAPFGAGPDLLLPRAHLRIVPGKVAGEPHLAHTRTTSRSIAALADRFDLDQIVAMYPDEDPVALAEAIDLERQLAA